MEGGRQALRRSTWQNLVQLAAREHTLLLVIMFSCHPGSVAGCFLALILFFKEEEEKKVLFGN